MPNEMKFATSFTCQPFADESESAEMPFESENNFQRITKKKGNDHSLSDVWSDQGQSDKELDNHQPTWNLNELNQLSFF